MSTIKARRATYMHHGYRQENGNEWLAYNARHAWCLAAMVM
jgi:hypothetical protein